MTTEKAQKVSIQELKKMVREAVALNLSKNKESAAERREKMEKDKEKDKNPSGKGVKKITLEQLRGMVKEAISLRLREWKSIRETMGEMPGEGDLVAFHGKTGYVVQVVGDKVAVTRNGIKMHTVPLAGVQVLATAEDLNDLSPEELDLLGKEMGFGQNMDPGEDPRAELERIEAQLDGHILSGAGRKALRARKLELDKKLGISSHEDALETTEGAAYQEEAAAYPLEEKKPQAPGEPYDRHEHGYLASMTWGQMPSDDLWEKAMQDGWNWRLNSHDREAFDVAMEMAGLQPHEVESQMGTPEGMKIAVKAMAECESEDPELDSVCERARDLASSVMDVLGFEWI